MPRSPWRLKENNLGKEIRDAIYKKEQQQEVPVGKYMKILGLILAWPC